MNLPFTSEVTEEEPEMKSGTWIENLRWSREKWRKKKKTEQRKLSKSKSSYQNHKKKRILIISLLPNEAKRNEKKKKIEPRKWKRKSK